MHNYFSYFIEMFPTSYFAYVYVISLVLVIPSMYFFRKFDVVPSDSDYKVVIGWVLIAAGFLPVVGIIFAGCYFMASINYQANGSSYFLSFLTIFQTIFVIFAFGCVFTKRN